MSDDMFYARVCAERDQLRAELAAAKSLLARIHRDGGHHTEAVGFARSVADAGDKVSEWLLVSEERTALAAHVERLEKALDPMARAYRISMAPFDHLTNGQGAAYCLPWGWPTVGDFAKANSALAATPAQSLAAHNAATKVAVLREVAEKQVYPEPHPVNDYVSRWLLAEADRVAKEAANDKA